MDADKPKCAAMSRQSGKPCKREPAVGLDKCSVHCGLSRAERERIAAELTARRQMTKAVATYGLARDVSPTEALLEEVRYTAGHVAWLREQVQALETGDLVWGMTEQAEKQATEFQGTDTTYGAKPSVWIELYYRERKHLVDVTKAAIVAGIEERRVRLAEAQGALVASVIRGILADLALTSEQQQRVPEVVPRRLRALAG